MSVVAEQPVAKKAKASQHKKEFHTDEVKPEVREGLVETEDDEPESVLSQIHVVDKELHGARVLSKDYLEQLAFMEEGVTVSFSQSHERFAAPFVDCSVNGKGIEALHNGRWLEVHQVPVNNPVTIKRKYLEVFARCKHTDIKAYSEGGRDGSNKPINRTDPNEFLKHPFSVLHDPNPRGHDWLIRILTDRA